MCKSIAIMIRSCGSLLWRNYYYCVTKSWRQCFAHYYIFYFQNYADIDNAYLKMRGKAYKIKKCMLIWVGLPKNKTYASTENYFFRQKNVEIPMELFANSKQFLIYLWGCSYSLRRCDIDRKWTKQQKRNKVNWFNFVTENSYLGFVTFWRKVNCMIQNKRRIENTCYNLIVVIY